MGRRIEKRPEARLDLLELYVFISQHSESTAARFLAAAEQTMKELAEQTSLGSPWESDWVEIQSLFFWLIKRFRKYLIFFLRHDDAIEIVRVLHSARNIEGLLESERP